VSTPDPLSRAAVEAVDREGLLGDVLAQPDQLGDALWRADSAGFERADRAGGVVVAGPRDEAIGGELAAAALWGRATRPLRTIRCDELDPGVRPETLVLCASYSGDDEPTVACFEAAGAAGAARAAVTTGGALGAAARAAGVPVMGVPGAFQPRTAVVYMTVAALAAAEAAGAAPQIRDEVEGAATLLRELAEEWGPDAPEDSEAKRLARAIDGTVPTVHGAGATEAVARRWRAQIRASGSATSAIFLDDGGQAEKDGERVHARGDTPFERIMSLVLLGDLVAVYLAVLASLHARSARP
jgi:glucose/mannose-6-phosphate isomerase